MTKICKQEKINNSMTKLSCQNEPEWTRVFKSYNYCPYCGGKIERAKKHA